MFLFFLKEWISLSLFGILVTLKQGRDSMDLEKAV